MAWLGLALFAVVIALLTVRYLFASPQKDASQTQSAGFTCPCYAPPMAPTKKEAE